jgi:hypothetical protein
MARTEIIIGGKLPAVLLVEFLDELNSTGAEVGRHDGADAAFQDAEQLRRALDDDGHLPLVADQDRQFDELARFCATHGIAFDRRIAAGKVYFRPDRRRPAVPDMNGDALLDSDNIRPIAKELAKLATVKLTWEKLLAATVKVIRHLHGLLPSEIKPLPPLEIGE